MEVGGHIHALAALLTDTEFPVPIGQKAGRDPELVCMW